MRKLRHSVRKYLATLIEEYKENWGRFREIHIKAFRRFSLVGAIGFLTLEIEFVISIISGGNYDIGQIVAVGSLCLFFLICFFFRGIIQKAISCFILAFDCMCLMAFTWVSYQVLLLSGGEWEQPYSEMALTSLIYGATLAISILLPVARALKFFQILIFLSFVFAGKREMLSADPYKFVLELTGCLICFSFAVVDKFKQTDIRAKLKDQLATEQEYRALIHTLPQSVVILDQDLNILHSNASYKRLAPVIGSAKAPDRFDGGQINVLRPRNEESNALLTDLVLSSRLSQLKVKQEESPSRPSGINRLISHDIVIEQSEVRKDSADMEEPKLTSFILRFIKKNIGSACDIAEEHPVYYYDTSVMKQDTGSGAGSPRNGVQGLGMKELHLEVSIRAGVFLGTPVAILVFSDVSQLRENIELKQINEDKTILLGSVAHEIRSPLGACISLMTCAVNDPEVPRVAKENYLSLAINSSKLLLHIVNDFLDYAQIDCKKIRIVMLPINLHAKLIEITQLLSFQASAKELELKLEYQGDNIPELVKIDPNRLSQILINLLNNSMKFTEKGSIHLRVFRLSPTSKLVRFEVIDTGLGINPENQAKLFSNFTKIDLGTKRMMNASGAGLGLVLCQKLLNLMGSKGLEVQSIVDHGSTFSFEIPIITESFIELPEGPAPRKNSPADLLKSRTQSLNKRLFSNIVGEPAIWIVDDNPFNLKALNMMLTPYKIDIVQFVMSQNALAKFREISNEEMERIGLVFLDLQMPVIDGMTLMKEMKEEMTRRFGKSVISFIACSGETAEAIQRKALEGGFSHYLIKPLIPSVLEPILDVYAVARK